MPLIQDLMKFMDDSVCNFLAVKTISSRLDQAGFQRLDASAKWDLQPDGAYYITKNDSAIFAWIVGSGDTADGVKIISSHCDSPGFRVKPSAEMMSEGGVMRLNTEVYGGPILYTWFDRPLSLAGRVIVKTQNPMRPEVRTIKIDRPLLTIPHLAIHFNRAVNDGNKLSKQKDMLPVIAIGQAPETARGTLREFIAEQLHLNPDEILDFDLTLYDTTKACLVGLDNGMLTSGRLDDLSMVHASLTALLSSKSSEPRSRQTRIMAVFDNEETGSATKQGAASPVLHNLLRRIAIARGATEEDFLRSIDNSFMISADNAHAIHPNYPEKHDPTNHPVLGGGPVIKINANCKYMTDAQSAAVFRSICDKAQVPCQYFVNHSDSPGGSTLGNILTSQIDLKGVDMGAAMWAMHSCRETISTRDHGYITKTFTEFYNL